MFVVYEHPVYGIYVTAAQMDEGIGFDHVIFFWLMGNVNTNDMFQVCLDHKKALDVCVCPSVFLSWQKDIHVMYEGHVSTNSWPWEI